jgi:pantothenate kinase
MDGFHHYNSWLDAHNLRAYKGAPETFDVDKLAQNLRQIRKKDSGRNMTGKSMIRSKAIRVTAPMVIVEGNWLLRDDERWRALAAFCDYSCLFAPQPMRSYATGGP